VANYLPRFETVRREIAMCAWTRLVVPLVFLFFASKAAHSFAFQGIGTPDGYGNRAYAISADGSTVAGITDSASGGFAFRWTASEGLQGLGITDGTVDHAFGLSGDGSLIVGTGSAGAFSWSSVTGPSFLGFHGASDISADGKFIVGTASNPPGSQPVYWSLVSGVTVLPGIAGAPHLGQALGISLDGSTIVGSVATGTNGGSINSEAAAWINGAVPLLLGAGPTSTAHAASADGSVIVGQYFANGEYRAFRWTKSGGFEALSEIAGTNDMRAFAVSGDGSIVVGEARDPVTGRNVAFVWDASHGTRVLSDVLAGVGQIKNWYLTEAWGISADGRFVTGHGVNPGGIAESWIARIIPGQVPEPGTLALLGLGFAGLGLSRRRSRTAS
jgi:uncharacterized membrane protein